MNSDKAKTQDATRNKEKKNIENGTLHYFKEKEYKEFHKNLAK